MTDEIIRQLAELENSTTDDLKARWRELMQTDPPAYSRSHLVRRLSYRIQEQYHGGLPDLVKGQLQAALEQRNIDPLDGTTFLEKNLHVPKHKGQPPVGTVYRKQWRDQEYVLTFLSRGVDVNGSRYSSASEAATKITGRQCNGYRWWGVSRGNRK